MDAQQRLLLEGCWEALGRSGPAAPGGQLLDPEAARAVAVAVGISYTEYYLNSVHQVRIVISMHKVQLWQIYGLHSYSSRAGGQDPLTRSTGLACATCC